MAPVMNGLLTWSEPFKTRLPPVTNKAYAIAVNTVNSA
jgi:hypothetical protein